MSGAFGGASGTGGDSAGRPDPAGPTGRPDPSDPGAGSRADGATGDVTKLLRAWGAGDAEAFDRVARRPAEDAAGGDADVSAAQWRHQLAQPAAVGDAVRIGQGDDVAGRVAYTVVARRRGPFGLLAQVTQAPGPRGLQRGDPLRRVVGGAVVHHDGTQSGHGLRLDGVQGPHQVRASVEGRDDDGHAGVTLPVQKADRQIFRARFVNFDERKAMKTCLELRRLAVDCLVMRAE